MTEDQLFLSHIRDALKRVAEYAADGRQRFMDEPMRQDAIVRQLEIVGEATKRLSPEVVESVQEIPWRRVASLRDRLIHAYSEVDLDRVWEVVVSDAPRLRRVVSALLDDG